MNDATLIFDSEGLNRMVPKLRKVNFRRQFKRNVDKSKVIMYSISEGHGTFYSQNEL